jgi:hypothetical protein
MDEDMEWIHVAQARIRWRILVNMVTNIFRIIRHATVRLLRKSLLY